jgi:foldase protein PrsA
MGRIKLLWGSIFVLILINVFTLTYFLSDETEPNKGTDKDINESVEYAAKVGEEYIPIKEVTDRLLVNYGESVLEELINRKLVFAESERLNFSISEEEIQQEISHMKQGYTSDEEFYNSLTEQIGITKDELKEEIEYYLLMEEMATKDINVEEEEMRSYYEDNIDSFYTPFKFHLHTILVPSEEEATQVIQEIEQGSSFEAVAAERSIDMITSNDGGDMGMVSADDFFLAHEIVQVAKQLPLNQISSPIATDDGYVIIKVSERIEGGLEDYSEVKAKIRREVALKQINGIAPFIESLREKIGVENYLYPSSGN